MGTVPLGEWDGTLVQNAERLSRYVWQLDHSHRRPLLVAGVDNLQHNVTKWLGAIISVSIQQLSADSSSMFMAQKNGTIVVCVGYNALSVETVIYPLHSMSSVLRL